MRLRGILTTVVILVSGALLVLNWQTATEYLPVNLLLVTVQLPLGLVLLVLGVGVILFFYFTSLLDHALHLSEVRRFEQKMDTLRGRLEARRQEEIEALDESHDRRFDEVVEKLDGLNAAVKGEIQRSLEAHEMRSSERLDDLRERVLLVRNELAADIAVTEDALKREVKGEEIEN